MNCPLCNAEEANKIHTDAHREYFKCSTCDLIFVPKEFHLSADDEKKRYDLHENNPDNTGYVQFLKQFIDPMMERISREDQGLDFGSGPNPVLADLFKKEGYSMDTYDVFFAKDESVFLKAYNFITATEVLEHLHQPLEEIEKLWSVLKSEGTLGIMTKFFADDQDFSKWRYKDDLTHVCFFSIKTFEWLASRLGAELEMIKKNIVFLKK